MLTIRPPWIRVIRICEAELSRSDILEASTETPSGSRRWLLSEENSPPNMLQLSVVMLGSFGRSTLPLPGTVGQLGLVHGYTHDVRSATTVQDKLHGAESMPDVGYSRDN